LINILKNIKFANFKPARKHFVPHRLCALFNLNVLIIITVSTEIQRDVCRVKDIYLWLTFLKYGVYSGGFKVGGPEARLKRGAL